LRLLQAFSKVFLAKAGTKADLPQEALENNLLGSENAFFHNLRTTQLTEHPIFGYSFLGYWGWCTKDHFKMSPELFEHAAFTAFHKPQAACHTAPKGPIVKMDRQ
jgi:hypothetical protein